MQIKRLTRLGLFMVVSFTLFACSDSSNTPPPNTVQPTLTSLWDNLFTGCGINCHTSTAADGTENGPDLSTKANFFTNLINKSVDNDYIAWTTELPPKGGTCNDVNFVTPGNANESTLAAALILNVSDTLAANHNCITAYSVHEVIKQTVSDNELKNALITWINNGAQNN